MPESVVYTNGSTENEENLGQKHTITGSVSHSGHQYKNFQQIPVQTRIQKKI